MSVPKQVTLEGRNIAREDFYAWAWKVFSPQGLLGVHEGTLLSGEAAAEGLETESWTVDAAEAPRERDWMAHRKTAEAEFHFSSREGAIATAQRLKAATGLTVGPIVEQPPEDWDAKWKASFLGNANGVSVAPFWRILPPWIPESEAGLKSGEIALRINPGAGFGTGTHETTQLCLQAIAESASPKLAGLASLKGSQALDFGSGSGILAVGAALLGARVDAIEIDPLAIDNARENAKLNGVERSIRFALELGSPRPYEVVIANILRPVLIQFCDELVRRIAPRGVLILSGLIEKDVRPVSEAYGSRLGGRQPSVSEIGEWRSLVWKIT